jgi:hypothetical protein
VTEPKHTRKRRPRRGRKSTAPQVPPRPPTQTMVDRPERLNAPWHPFPLVELCILAGIGCIITGLVAGEQLVLAFGVALGALGGLDTSAREHFGGHRSHTLVLAGLPAVLIAALTAFAEAPLYVVVAVMLVAFALAFVSLRRAWDRTQARTPA